MKGIAAFRSKNSCPSPKSCSKSRIEGSPETKRARRSAPLGSNRGHCFRLTTVRRKEVARLRAARHDYRLGKPTLAGSPGPDYRDIDLRSEPRHVSPTAERTSGALAAISLTSLLVIASANE